MSLPDGFTMRVASADDVAAIAEMRVAVGWTAHEWALLLAIEPANARCVVVIDPEGRLAAVGSGVAYPPLGVVGNMIVAERHRRRGFGSAVLDAAVAFLREVGCTRLELYATTEGRPLYARHGFDAIEAGSLAAFRRDQVNAHRSVNAVAARHGDLDELVAYDTPRFGGPRTALLERIVADTARPALVARRNGAVAGYGWVRPEDRRIGPWIADDPSAAAAILAEAFRLVRDAAELTANIPMSNEVAVAWARSLGVEPNPWDGRMALGAPVPRRDATIYGNAVGALG